MFPGSTNRTEKKPNYEQNQNQKRNSDQKSRNPNKKNNYSNSTPQKTNNSRDNFSNNSQFVRNEKKSSGSQKFNETGKRGGNFRDNPKTNTFQPKKQSKYFENNSMFQPTGSTEFKDKEFETQTRKKQNLKFVSSFFFFKYFFLPGIIIIDSNQN